MAGARPASRLKGRKQNQRTGKGKIVTDDTGSGTSDTKFDESVLRKPIETSVTGLLKAIQVIQSGTKEIRDYLANECEIIYECRICRSMFRSLANFILHKRSYCQETFTDVYTERFQDDENLYIQSEANPDQAEDDQDMDVSKSKDLSSIIDRLAKKTFHSLPPTDVKLKDLEFSKEDDTKNVLLSLQTVDGTNAGMFQTMSECGNLEEFIKTEVMELHMMENDGGAVIGPDGRCLGFRPLVKKTDPLDSTAIEELPRDGKIECVHCNQKFSTKKTLRFHVNTKHNESRLVYPCPDCTETFVNPWGVYRHLFKVHRRTASEVRKLRNVIQSSSFQMDQAPLKKIRTDPVLQVTLTEQERLDEENKAWMDNLECDNDLQCCGGCGRRFERKAALHSHSLMCQKRIAARNNFTSSKTKQRAPPPEDKNTTKANKGALKRKGTLKKKILSDDNLTEKSTPTPTPEVSRPPSEAEVHESTEIITSDPIGNETSRRDSFESGGSQSLKLIVSDDDSLQEVPVKDPLEVSDCEESEPTFKNTPLIEEIYGKEICYESKDNLETNDNLPTTSIVEKIAESTTENTDISSNVTSESKHQRFVNDMLGARIKIFTSVGKKFVCMPCDYRYSSLTSLRRHMAIHFNWKRFKCLRCDFMSFDKRESLVHAQTSHHASLDLIKKYVARMSESESDKHSSKVFLPLNTTPQEIITLDDSDEDSNKQLRQSKDEIDEKDDYSQTNSNSNNDSDSNNEFSRNLIMEMILGVSESDQKIDICPYSTNAIESIDRSTSSTEESPKAKTSENLVSSRPVRNRVKPVNKDFIYDMSALTKDDNYDGMYVTSKQLKRKVDSETRDNEKSQTKCNNTESEISIKKKRRRNSKVFLNSSNSNSSTEITDNIKIVPLMLTQSTECNSSLKADSIRNDKQGGYLNEDELMNDLKNEDSPFIIQSVMSINT